MGRQPCCDKLGVKRGPWTAEEDRKLINFILTNGHCCWRAVPKLAGLLRCGKSCRLRWTNYLRPDLKRGLLTDAEEQVVIDLHGKLGNRYVVIDACASVAHPSITLSRHAYAFVYGTCGVVHSIYGYGSHCYEEQFSYRIIYPVHHIILCTTPYMTIIKLGTRNTYSICLGSTSLPHST